MRKEVYFSLDVHNAILKDGKIETAGVLDVQGHVHILFTSHPIKKLLLVLSSDYKSLIFSFFNSVDDYLYCSDVVLFHNSTIKWRVLTRADSSQSLPWSHLIHFDRLDKLKSFEFDELLRSDPPVMTISRKS